jgi:uncharacterized protein YjiS (DUF1127 family)
MHFMLSCAAAIIPFAPRNPSLPFVTRIVDSGTFAKGTAMIVAIIRFFQVWKRYNAGLRELSQLGDRELADIGITRGDIHRIAWDNANS